MNTWRIQITENSVSNKFRRNNVVFGVPENNLRVQSGSAEIMIVADDDPVFLIEQIMTRYPFLIPIQVVLEFNR